MRNYIAIEENEIICTNNIQTLKTTVTESKHSRDGVKYTEYTTNFFITYENGKEYRFEITDEDKKRPFAKRVFNEIWDLLDD